MGRSEMGMKSCTCKVEPGKRLLRTKCSWSTLVICGRCHEVVAPLRVFTCSSFKGHYVGGSAVVVAGNETRARVLLDIELRNQLLDGLAADDEVTELDLYVEGVEVLADGDY